MFGNFGVVLDVLDLGFHGFGPLEQSIHTKGSTHKRDLYVMLNSSNDSRTYPRKVFAAVSEPNYGVPWVYKAQDARTGTAFAVWWVKGGHLAV